jgi:hypothetical protein
MSFQIWNPDWFSLPGQAVFDREHQRIAAVSRGPGNLDLFVIGFDNKIWTTFWTDHSGWHPDWFPLPGQAVFDHQLQEIAAVSRAPGNLDLFVIGFDNKVWSTFWTEQASWHPDWFPLPGQAVFDREHQCIAAVSRAHGNLDLFVIGFDNKVWTTFWNDQVNWNPDWIPLPGQAVFDHQLQRVAAVSRAPGHLDLFVLGFDNHSWSTFWGPRNPMTLDVRIDQTSPTVPLQVGLHIGATDGIVTETNWNATKNGVLIHGIGDKIPSGIALDRGLAIGDPGSYVITVNRTGLTGPSGPTTLTKQMGITAQRPAPPTPPPPPLVHPHINVIANGDGSFTVSGSLFLHNATVHIRVVDPAHANDQNFNTGSDGGGNFSGFKTPVICAQSGPIYFSANDGRSDPNDHPLGVLWSNTVPMSC